MKIIPTKGQAECVKQAAKRFKKMDNQSFVYAGPAGTGKTTIAKQIIKSIGLELDEVLFITFTGKASSILTLKGMRAYTIHSALMELVEVPVMMNGEILYRNGRVVKEEVFRRRKYLDPRIKCIFLDEWGTVDKELHDIIFSFGLPVIASGDEYQLPPIFGESPFAEKIDFRLWEITRQAEGSGIIQLATLFREGRDFEKFMNFYNQAYIKPYNLLKADNLKNASVILTNKNKTRELINNKMRDMRGFKSRLPQVGDKMVCRKNNNAMMLGGVPLTNGTTGLVINPLRTTDCNFAKDIYRIDFMPDYILDIGGYEYYDSLPCDYKFLTEPCGQKEINKYNRSNKLEYAYALTVYLAQGSQYDKVTYLDEITGDKTFMNRTRYTATTRAVNYFEMYV